MAHSFRIQPSSLRGEITLPSSKSQTLRAIIFAALCSGKSKVDDYLPSPDTLAMISACRLMGASIDVKKNSMEIQGLCGKIENVEDIIDAGNSGIVLRFCSAVSALSYQPVVITGDYSIRHYRPMQALLSGLNQLGAKAISTRGDGYAPIIIQGPLLSGKATIRGEDSQPVSALLIAAAFSKGPIEIFVENPGEKPWVNLTLEWFKRLNIPHFHQEFSYYHLPGNATPSSFNYRVPGDLSSLSFPVAAALITQSELCIKNVDLEDPQGDKQLLEVLMKMGANFEYCEKEKTLKVHKCKELIGQEIDINNFIDSIAILAVIACFAKGTTRIYNAAIARHKESNRIGNMATELRKMGGKVTETDDGLLIEHSPLRGASLHSYNDHRIAMSLTIAALASEGISSISAIDCIHKTFPTFFSDFKLIGADICREEILLESSTLP